MRYLNFYIDDVVLYHKTMKITFQLKNDDNTLSPIVDLYSNEIVDYTIPNENDITQTITKQRIVGLLSDNSILLTNEKALIINFEILNVITSGNPNALNYSDRHPLYEYNEKISYTNQTNSIVYDNENNLSNYSIEIPLYDNTNNHNININLEYVNLNPIKIKFRNETKNDSLLTTSVYNQDFVKYRFTKYYYNNTITKIINNDFEELSISEIFYNNYAKTLNDFDDIEISGLFIVENIISRTFSGLTSGNVYYLHNHVPYVIDEVTGEEIKFGENIDSIIAIEGNIKMLEIEEREALRISGRFYQYSEFIENGNQYIFSYDANIRHNKKTVMPYNFFSREIAYLNEGLAQYYNFNLYSTSCDDIDVKIILESSGQYKTYNLISSYLGVNPYEPHVFINEYNYPYNINGFTYNTNGIKDITKLSKSISLNTNTSLTLSKTSILSTDPDSRVFIIKDNYKIGGRKELIKHLPYSGTYHKFSGDSSGDIENIYILARNVYGYHNIQDGDASVNNTDYYISSFKNISVTFEASVDGGQTYNPFINYNGQNRFYFNTPQNVIIKLTPKSESLNAIYNIKTTDMIRNEYDPLYIFSGRLKYNEPIYISSFLNYYSNCSVTYSTSFSCNNNVTIGLIDETTTPINGNLPLYIRYDENDYSNGNIFTNYKQNVTYGIRRLANNGIGSPSSEYAGDILIKSIEINGTELTSYSNSVIQYNNNTFDFSFNALDYIKDNTCDYSIVVKYELITHKLTTYIDKNFNGLVDTGIDFNPKLKRGAYLNEIGGYDNNVANATTNYSDEILDSIQYDIIQNYYNDFGFMINNTTSYSPEMTLDIAFTNLGYNYTQSFNFDVSNFMAINYNNINFFSSDNMNISLNIKNINVKKNITENMNTKINNIRVINLINGSLINPNPDGSFDLYNSYQYAIEIDGQKIDTTSNGKLVLDINGLIFETMNSSFTYTYYFNVPRVDNGNVSLDINISEIHTLTVDPSELDTIDYGYTSLEYRINGVGNWKQISFISPTTIEYIEGDTIEFIGTVGANRNYDPNLLIKLDGNILNNQSFNWISSNIVDFTTAPQILNRNNSLMEIILACPKQTVTIIDNINENPTEISSVNMFYRLNDDVTWLSAPAILYIKLGDKFSLKCDVLKSDTTQGYIVNSRIISNAHNIDISSAGGTIVKDIPVTNTNLAVIQMIGFVNELTITTSDIVSNSNITLSNVRYRINSGSWVSFTLGSPITGLLEGNNISFKGTASISNGSSNDDLKLIIGDNISSTSYTRAANYSVTLYFNNRVIGTTTNVYYDAKLITGSSGGGGLPVIEQ